MSNLNNGGYVLVEAADAEVVYSFVSKVVYWNDVTVVPLRRRGGALDEAAPLRTIRQRQSV